jgi:hypothetical protein
MAIQQYLKLDEFNEVKNLLPTEDDLSNVVAILVLKAKHNVIDGNRPFQININDVKNFFPIIYRNQYANKYKYKLNAKSDNLDGHILLRYNLQNNYEYVQITFDGAIQDFKSSLDVDKYFAIVKFKNSNVMRVYHTTSDKELLTLNVSELINDITVFEPPIIEETIKASNTIYFGSPGTGKSYEVNQITKPYRLINPKRVEIVTFHPEYDYHSFVGSYKPTMTVDGKISYAFVEQIFTRIYISAWQDEENEYFLQIEEINRGNCAEIFGDLFQLLDRNPDYKVTADEDLKKHLQNELGIDHKGILDGQISLPSNLNLIATMNTSDQSLFPMDSAFKRRWDWKYVPIKYEDDCTDASKDYLIKLDGLNYKWLTFLEKINKEIFNATESQDKQIGNWFVSPKQGNIIDSETIVNKVIFYLWNDIFKEEDEHNIFKVTDEKASEFGIETDMKVITFEKYFEGGARYRIPILKYLFNEVLSMEPI